MRDRSFSQEERMQREKEVRSRQRKQEQAYREAQRGVYSRIYEEQNAMPEDYRQAFWEDPRDRLYDRDHPGRPEPAQEEDWEEETRQQVQEDLWDDPSQAALHPAAGSAPPGGIPRRPTGQRTREPPEPPVPGGGRGCLAAIVSRQVQVKKASRKRGAQPPQRTRGQLDPGAASPSAGGGRFSSFTHRSAGPGGRRVIIHQIYVRPRSQGRPLRYRPQRPRRQPRKMVYTFLLVGRDDGSSLTTPTPSW